MTLSNSARLSASWPAAEVPCESPTPVELTATAPLGAAALISDSFRVLGAFAFGKRATRQNGAALCELLDRMN